MKLFLSILISSALALTACTKSGTRMKSSQITSLVTKPSCVAGVDLQAQARTEFRNQVLPILNGTGKCVTCHATGHEFKASSALSENDAWSSAIHFIDRFDNPVDSTLIQKGSGGLGHGGGVVLSADEKAKFLSWANMEISAQEVCPVEASPTPSGSPNPSPDPSSSPSASPSPTPEPSGSPDPSASPIPSPPPSTATQKFELVKVQAATCIACHSSVPGNRFKIADRNTLLRLVENWDDATNSTLIKKGSGTVTHGGGNALGNLTATWVDWIAAEAAIDAELSMALMGTPPISPTTCSRVQVTKTRISKPGSTATVQWYETNLGIDFFTGNTCLTSLGQAGVGTIPTNIYFKRKTGNLATSAQINAQGVGGTIWSAPLAIEFMGASASPSPSPSPIPSVSPSPSPRPSVSPSPSPRPSVSPSPSPRPSVSPSPSPRPSVSPSPSPRPSVSPSPSPRPSVSPSPSPRPSVSPSPSPRPSVSPSPSPIPSPSPVSSPSPLPSASPSLGATRFITVATQTTACLNCHNSQPPSTVLRFKSATRNVMLGLVANWDDAANSTLIQKGSGTHPSGHGGGTQLTGAKRQTWINWIVGEATTHAEFTMAIVQTAPLSPVACLQIQITKTRNSKPGSTATVQWSDPQSSLDFFLNSTCTTALGPIGVGAIPNNIYFKRKSGTLVTGTQIRAQASGATAIWAPPVAVQFLSIAPSPVPSPSPRPSVSPSPSPRPSVSPSPSPRPSVSPSPSPRPSVSPSPSPRPSVSPSPSPRPSVSPSPSPRPSVSPSPSPRPSVSPSPSPRPSVSPSPSPRPTVSPTPAGSPVPTPSPAPSPTPSSGAAQFPVVQTQAATCTGCHSGSNRFQVADRNIMLSLVENWNSPTASTLIKKPSGTHPNGHGGGNVFSGPPPKPIIAIRQTWIDWITAEANTHAEFTMALPTNPVTAIACARINILPNRIPKPNSNAKVQWGDQANALEFYTNSTCITPSAIPTTGISVANLPPQIFFKRKATSAATSTQIQAGSTGGAIWANAVNIQFTTVPVTPAPTADPRLPLPTLTPDSEEVNPALKQDLVETSLSRTRGSLTYVRLSRLFPGNDSTLRPVLTATSGIEAFFANPDRPATIPAQLALSQIATKLCQIPSANHNLFKPSAMIAEGSLPPSDPALRAAMLAARNAWLYPYLKSDRDVVRLRDLYNQIIRTAEATDEDAKQALCLASLGAFQFWIGNEGRLDTVRRITLELGGRIPAMADYQNFLKPNGEGVDDDIFREQLRLLIQTIQTDSKSAPTYKNAVLNWHKEWLGLRSIFNNNFLSSSHYTDPRYRGGSSFNQRTGGFATIGGQFFDLIKATPDANFERIEHSYYRGGLGGYNGSDSCDRTQFKEQEFDPRTTKIVWQHKNHHNGLWETIGSFAKNNSGVWVEQKGSITLANGTTSETSLADITLAAFDLSNKAINRYKAGNLRGIAEIDGFTAEERRILRYSPSGLQNGYSKVKLWFSGQEAYVCNGGARFLAACAYRTETPETSIYNGISLSPTWTPKTKGFSTRFSDTVFHPEILDKFRCGVPDLNAITRDADFSNDLAAFPKGLPGVTNALAYNVRISAPAGTQEYTALQQLYEDLELETARFISNLLDPSKNYKDLVTGDYTLGRPVLEFFLRTNAMDLPGYPPGTYKKPGEEGYLTTAPYEIHPKTFARIPLRWLRNRGGNIFTIVPMEKTINTLAHPAGAYLTQMYKDGETTLQPRPVSGILTQASLIAPVSPKVRTLAARYFTRLLCKDNPSGVAVTEPGTPGFNIQKGVLDKLNDSKEHRDSEGDCITCHKNMDPLAAVLAGGFSEKAGNYPFDGTGEMLPIGTGSETQILFGLMWGGKPSAGAFLGKKISGVEDAGEALAEYHEFSSCVAKIAFKNLYGRSPIIRPGSSGTINEFDSILKTAVWRASGHTSTPAGIPAAGDPLNFNKLLEELLVNDAFWKEN